MKEQLYRPTQSELIKAQEIYGLIGRGVREGKLKPRTFTDIVQKFHTFTTHTHQDRVVACGALELDPPTAYMRSLYVAPEHRGKGLFKKLTEGFIERSRASGIREITLHTFTPQLFHGGGFVEHGEPYQMRLEL